MNWYKMSEKLPSCLSGCSEGKQTHKRVLMYEPRCGYFEGVCHFRFHDGYPLEGRTYECHRIDRITTSMQIQMMAKWIGAQFNGFDKIEISLQKSDIDDFDPFWCYLSDIPWPLVVVEQK